MPRIKLIMNPTSDRGRTAEIGETLQILLKERAEAASTKHRKYDLDWSLTEHPGHATDLAHDAAKQGFDIVTAVGGDGTVHEVVNGLMKVNALRRPKLAVLPVGSGNDFAHNAGLPIDPGDAAHCLFGEQHRRIDVGTIKDGTGRMVYWDNTISLGFGGAVSIASRKITFVHGFAMYFIAVMQTILFKPPALDTRIQFDDLPEQERGISMMSICNGPREGGGFPVAPNAVMDDGLISYMIMRKMGRLPMLYFVPVVMSAKHLNYKKSFEEGTATKLRIEADSTLAIHTDGEIFGPWEADIRQIEVGIIPGGIEVMCGC